MSNSHHTKSLNLTGKGRNRHRFSSTKERSKRASADVYRRFKRRLGNVTSAASREERVHHPHLEESRDLKRRRTESSAVVVKTKNDDVDEQLKIATPEFDDESTFASELDLARDRNASEIFEEFYRDIWHLVRSLSEVLHYSKQIVNVLLSYLVSPETKPNTRSDLSSNADHESRRPSYIVNNATTDILHLLAVLARDLRHEMHPFLHNSVIPRIIMDLLNPPPPPADSGKQPIPLDVAVVEAAFRTMSYMFRYSAEPLLSEVDPKGKEPTLDALRQHYGSTLGHRRSLIRRLAAETFAPLLRKIKTNSGRSKHFKRVVRALATTTTEGVPLSRAQTDAIDGISWLFLETARGVTNQLHSKGHLVIRCALDILIGYAAKPLCQMSLVHEINAALLDKCLSHVKSDQWEPIWEELFLVLKGLKEDDSMNGVAFGCCCKLLSQAVQLREGIFVKGSVNHPKAEREERLVQEIIASLEVVISSSSFPKFPPSAQQSSVDLLCHVWKCSPAVTSGLEVAHKCLRHLLSLRDNIPWALKIGKELLPTLDSEEHIQFITEQLLNACSEMAKTDQHAALRVLFVVALRPSSDNDKLENDKLENDNLTPTVGSAYNLAGLSMDVLRSLENMCTSLESTNNLYLFAFVARTIPFVHSLSLQRERSGNVPSNLRSFLVQQIEKLSQALKSDPDQLDVLVPLSLGIQAYGASVDDCVTVNKPEKKLLKPIRRVQVIALNILKAHPGSIWAVKAASSLRGAFDASGFSFQKEADELFSLLVPNLMTSNHFLRLHSLRILNLLPKRPFVTDHASVDLTDDLDEETSFRPSDQSSSSHFAGLCDVLELLAKLEVEDLSLESERRQTTLLRRIEAMARSGRLPVVYTEAVAHHLLGLLNMRFSPLWTSVVNTLVVLGTSHPESAWKPLNGALNRLLHDVEIPAVKTDLTADGTLPKGHFALCKDWGCDSSLNKNGLLKEQLVRAEEEGRVSKHLSTDRETVFEHVLTVLQRSPELTAKKSRMIVPVFLAFLHHQYLSDKRSPTARELQIEECLTDDEKEMKLPTVSRGILQKRLIGFLKVFSAVNGPQQLYHNKFLLKVFTSLLSHQEESVAELALSCMINYNLPYLKPYGEQLKSMLRRGQLRHALLSFDMKKSSGTIHDDHRNGTISVVCRILFGRLSARSSVTGKAPETPDARRNAIFAFLAPLESNELFPIVYLMTRRYIKEDFSIQSLECLAIEDGKKTIQMALKGVSITEIKALPDQVNEGFLNVLGAVIGQIGFSMIEYLPALMTILLEIAKSYAADTDIERNEPRRTEENEDSGSNRSGHIRTLCCRRLIQIFEAFSNKFDFLPYADPFWQGIEPSIRHLPAIAGNCIKPPAVLCLMSVLSKRRSLTRFLEMNRLAIRNVLQCIASTTEENTLHLVLEFIECLLVQEDQSRKENTQVTQGPILREIPLLLSQFTERLEGKILSRKGKPGTRNEELSILCLVSQAILHAERSGTTAIAYDESVLRSLCVLLVSFVDKVNEKDQLDTLAILVVLIPKLSKESVNSLLPDLSRCFGPVKRSKPLESLLVRSSVACAIQSIATVRGDIAFVCVSEAAVNACATHPSRVDELNFDKVLPALNGLGGDQDGSWKTYLPMGSDAIDASPLVHISFFYLHYEDGVLSRAAFKSLKKFIALAASGDISMFRGRAGRAGERSVESLCVPYMRHGISSKNLSIKRYSVLLLAETARLFRESTSPNLFGDLASLSRDDEDLDFFLNITHVQLHRRSRALQRLRKQLESTTLSIHTLSNVLMPLALYPIYESMTKAEETFVLEGIATAGGIARHLSWSKYHNVLWTALTQLERHPQQERAFVGLICTLIDSFHFDTFQSQAEDGNAIWRALNNRIIPKTEQLLIKEKTDRRGNRVKLLRPSVLLALLKLFQKFSTEFFEAKLPKLLTTVCDCLARRESDTRDLARTALAKMTTSMDLKYLKQVIQQMAVALSEGFKLHVRNATLHTILLELAQSGRLPLDKRDSTEFDSTIPALMDLIQQDLFGDASEHREAEAAKRYVKEASGSKSNDSIELVCRLLYFSPSSKLSSKEGLSSVHAVVSPLLERLRDNNVSSAVLGKVREALNRVIVGLSRNETTQAQEAFPFVYACVVPFVGEYRIGRFLVDSDDDNSDDEGLSLTVSSSSREKVTESEDNAASKRAVVEWRPSYLNKVETATEAKKRQQEEKARLAKVHDGENAPKLTGSQRRINSRKRNLAQQSWNDPASVNAVLFGLGLLRSVLKKAKLIRTQMGLELIEPLVPLLTSCVYDCRNTEVVLLALRCLEVVLTNDIPAARKCSAHLGEKTLEILASSGSISNIHGELTQACFKILGRIIGTLSDKEAPNENKRLPLPSAQMRVLVSLLSGAVEATEHHNQTIGLIKMIAARRYMSPEFYDLMEKLLQLSVRSHQSSLRQQCSNVFVNYLLDYPMSTERLNAHLRQVVLNMRYEFEEGRLSAILLSTSIIEKLPLPVLHENAQLFFLPLVLQLVNDESKQCRETVATCITGLLTRLPMNAVVPLFEYNIKWVKGDDSDLIRTSLQVFGLFVDAKPELICRRSELVTVLLTLLKPDDGGDRTEDWEKIYFSLICLEKMMRVSSASISKECFLWVEVTRMMGHPHSWVKLVSSRLVGALLQLSDPMSLGRDPNSVLVQSKGLVFRITQQVCTHIDSKETDQNDDLSSQTIKTLSWLIQAMLSSPGLFYSANEDGEENDVKDGDAEDNATNDADGDRDPVRWLLTRLCHLGRPKGPKRRSTVFKAFAAFATFGGEDLLRQLSYLELMLEPLQRSITEAKNSISATENETQQAENGEATLAEDVMRLLEEKIGDDNNTIFIDALSAVQKRAKAKKEQRQQQAALLALTDPVLASKRKIQKQQQEKKRRKRQIEKRRHDRGGRKKVRHN